MTGAWVAIGLILVGLPLLAWWVGGRQVWSRLRPGRDHDPWGDTVRRHGLGPGEVARVRTAVTQGQELADPRLRAAAVDWAQQELGTRSGRSATWAGVVLGLALAGFLARVVVVLAEGRWGDVHWVTLAYVVGGAVFLVQRRRKLRRAVRLNAGPPGGGTDQRE